MKKMLQVINVVLLSFMTLLTAGCATRIGPEVEGSGSGLLLQVNPHQQ